MPSAQRSDDRALLPEELGCDEREVNLTASPADIAPLKAGTGGHPSRRLLPRCRRRPAYQRFGDHTVAPRRADRAPRPRSLSSHAGPPHDGEMRAFGEQEVFRGR
jgi:hypothetical protein